MRNRSRLLVLGWLLLAAPTAQAGLCHRWPLDDATGTSARDATGLGATGTLSGNPVWIAGRVGGALDCDGATDFVSMTTAGCSASTTTATYTAWIRWDATPVSFDGLLFNIGGARGLLISGAAAQITAMWEGTSDEYNATTGLAPTLGQWHFVAVVFTPTAATIYRDTTTFTNTKTHTVKNMNDPHRLCSDTRFADRDADIAIDDARIYNHALTAAELDYLRIRGRFAR